jgi:hypothetical protein
MIRREDLSGSEAGESAAHVRDEMAGGRPVRITGLGVLARIEVDTTGPAPWNLPGPRKFAYRLTLTAAVANAEVPFRGKHPAPDGNVPRELHDDARHLAHALGAPVEVHVPKRPPFVKGPEYPTLITTVSP